MPSAGWHGPEEVSERLGYDFAEPALLETALTHTSWSSEHDGSRGNQRLEFLGDAVLDLVVGERLYRAHPRWSEGELTRARSSLVNTRALAREAESLGLGVAARLGRTEARSGGEHKPRILASLFEAVVGALYLDAGLAPVEALVERRFGAAIEGGEAVLARDPKTEFQEWAHARGLASPQYAGVGDSGVEDADDRFTVEVRLEGEAWGCGIGRTKRAAERAAAREALARVERGTPPQEGSPE